jgi:hypothetical protein
MSHIKQSSMERSTIFPIIYTSINVVAKFELFICHKITCIFYFCTMFIYLQIVRKSYIRSLYFLLLFHIVREITPTLKP